MSGKRAHVHEIDVVRVLTFACVIGVHTLSEVNPGPVTWPNALLMILHFTRSAFFALTGFVLTFGFRDRDVSPRPFWRKRITLVGVPYLTWSVIYTLLGQVDEPSGSLGGFLGELLRNIALGDAWYHLYFLLVSMQIYLLFPWILKFVRALRGHHAALLVVSAVVQIAVVAVLRYTTPAPGWQSWLATYSDSIVVTYQFYVLLGAVAAFHLDRLRDVVRAHAAAVLGGVVVVAVLTEAFFVLEVARGVVPTRAATVLQPAMVPWSAAATAGLFALGVIWSDRHSPEGRQARWLRTASDRSFGVFLSHPLVLWVVLFVGGDWLRPALSGPGTTVLAYLLVVAGAIGFTELARHTRISMPLTGRPPLAEVAAAAVKRARERRPAS